jgi:hypothetical protein
MCLSKTLISNKKYLLLLIALIFVWIKVTFVRMPNNKYIYSQSIELDRLQLSHGNSDTNQRTFHDILQT